ncbi:uncharacterized protein LOC114424188 [Glycine soja]|uniref:uncharacterized protein LOC114424188 n=1 Tax=Glycine soja TaxID=3848 RepID=UPI0010392179|nr:uncharacterized protein LOC114424188 [Glycine soja]
MAKGNLKGVDYPTLCVRCLHGMENLWHIFFIYESSEQEWRDIGLWSHIADLPLRFDSFQEAFFHERVVEDLPTAVEELNKEQQEAPVEEVVTDVEGFSGEPHDTSVMRDFEHHIALRVWNGEERPELKLSSHGRKMTKFGRPTPEIEGLMAASRRSPLIAWAFHNFEQLHVDDAVDMLVELLESGTYALDAAALVHMIYEHFLFVGSALAAKDYDERRPPACQWTSSKALSMSTYCRYLDRLTPEVVCWIPYGDHRSFREFQDISLFFDHLR